MGSILDKIILVKKREVEKLKSGSHIAAPIETKKRSLLHKLEKADGLVVLAEFKRASPSKGVINEGLDPKEQARNYEDFGADAISVLTDETFFKGSHKDLAAVYETVNLPILCKDFIIDESQISQAKEAGASLILLIVAALNFAELKRLYTFALANELEVLVEVHNEAEAKQAIELGVKIIGVNNRDLNTFHVDLSMTEKLAPFIKSSGAFLISESGMKTSADVGRVIRAGADGILVGEAFMKADDVEKLLKTMKSTDSGKKEKRVNHHES